MQVDPVARHGERFEGDDDSPEPQWDEADWDEDSAATRRLGLSDALRGLGLALGAGLLIALAGVGTVVVLVVASLGPSHRNGPGEGRNSRHLPVTATPAADLQAGTIVRVRASRLANAHGAIIAMCAAEAEIADRGVIAACDLAHRNLVPVHQGKVVRSFRVSRSITLQHGRQVQCASRPGSCVLMVASAENYDRSGFAPLTFLDGGG